MVVILLLAVGLGASLIGGFVTVKGDGYSCLGGRRWVAQVDKQRLWAVGKLNVYYQPYSYICPEERQFDPNVYQNIGGRLEVKQN